jgi:amino-acid N-acetyltransferase
VQEEWESIVSFLEQNLPDFSNLDVSQTTFYCAAQGKRLVGCAGARRYGETVLAAPLAVLPEFRGHGIALNLLRAHLRKARADGCRSALIFRRHNAAKLFCQHGFAPVPPELIPEQVRVSKTYQWHTRRRFTCMRCDL